LRENPLADLPFSGVRMISMHATCLSVITSTGTFRYQFESERDLRDAFSAWCETAAEKQCSDQHDGLNIAVLRH
jgi:hypothetical protein